MLQIPLIEWLGFLASLIVAVSLTMTSVVRLRIINTIGSLIFSIYGFIIGAYPVFVLNGFIVIVNVIYLIKMYRTKDFFEIIDCSQQDAYMSYFEKHYSQDIMHFFPDSGKEATADVNSYLILKNSQPIGLLKGVNNDSNFVIDVDYVIPEYRDFKTGKFLFHYNKQFFADKGIRVVSISTDQPNHIAYIKRLGFTQKESKNLYQLNI
ncbi:YgjV family protein [Spirochaeta cellobiosiphila]|uniref:YgjV family protein n=1 Tax=Spirochaeta cellobiosiphila TaxID=504483 RepID=UPI0003F7320D|nr:YgjV family protein [Spirochaeta cellobiosiphila]